MIKDTCEVKPFLMQAEREAIERKKKYKQSGRGGQKGETEGRIE